MYCSMKCRGESRRRYHGKECPVFLAASPFIDQNSATALRVLMTALTRFGSVYNLSVHVQRLEASTAADKRIRGYDDQGEYSSAGYASVHFLLNHTETQSFVLLNITSAKAAILVIFMERHGDATLRQELKKFRLRIFVGGLLMKYLLGMHVNLSVVSSYKTSAPFYEMTGRGLFPVGSMFNHDCLPNAMGWHSKGVLTITSFTAIAKGEEVSIVYYTPFKSSHTCKRLYHINEGPYILT